MRENKHHFSFCTVFLIIPFLFPVSTIHTQTLQFHFSLKLSTINYAVILHFHYPLIDRNCSGLSEKMIHIDLNILKLGCCFLVLFIQCDGLKKNMLLWLKCLNAYPPVNDTVWEELGAVALLG